MAKQDDWMEKLVKNYQLPEDKPKVSEPPKQMLTEAQKKIISSKS
jgi:hypothetical protein